MGYGFVLVPSETGRYIYIYSSHMLKLKLPNIHVEGVHVVESIVEYPCRRRLFCACWEER